MNKRLWAKVAAIVTVAMLLLALSACDRVEQQAVQLCDGWLIRGDAQDVGEADGWQRGFSADEADGNLAADIVWYSNTFHPALSRAERLILNLSDVDEGAKVWLNGKQLDYNGAWGDTRIDVTDIAKRNGNNTLVIRTENGKAWSLTRTTLRATSDTAIMAVEAHASSHGDLDVQVQLLDRDASVQMTVTAADTGRVMTRVTADSENQEARLKVTLNDVIAWTAQKPYLYTLEITAGEDRYSTDIGFAAHGINEQGIFIDDGEPVMIKAAVMPASVMLDDAKMRTFIDFIRVVGFNMLQTETGRPTQSVLDYCSATGIYVCDDGGRVSAPAIAGMPDKGIAVFGKELQMPEQVDATALQAWYDQYGLDRQYANAAQAYEAVGAAHVQAIEAQLRQLRGAEAINGFVYAGSILPYPDTMLDVLSDSVNDLRFCIEAPDVAEVGDRLAFTVKLADYYVLWERDFTATVTVSGPDGVIYEKKVTVSGQKGNRTQTLLSDSVVLTGDAGDYTVAAVFDNYAHPTCGQKTVTVWGRGEMPATVYAVDLPDDARAALSDWGVGVADAVKTTA